MGPLTPLVRWLASRLPVNTFRIALHKAGGARIGPGTDIERGARLGNNVTIGRDCVIKTLASMHDCELGDGVKIDTFTLLNFVKMGDRSQVDRGSMIIGARDRWAVIGKEVVVGVNWMIDGTGGLEVEEFVNLGSHLGGIFTHSGLRQRLLGRPFREKERLELSPVKVGTCTWVGGKVTIQPGVTIGHHCAVLPNSSVTKDIPPYTMVSGVPAKPIKRIRVENDNVEFLPLEG